jgi:hypothetical protein
MEVNALSPGDESHCERVNWRLAALKMWSLRAFQWMLHLINLRILNFFGGSTNYNWLIVSIAYSPSTSQDIDTIVAFFFMSDKILRVCFQYMTPNTISQPLLVNSSPGYTSTSILCRNCWHAANTQIKFKQFITKVWYLRVSWVTLQSSYWICLSIVPKW